MTELVMEAASDLCDGKVVLVHEGGYSEAYVPFCGHAAIAQLAGNALVAPDPMAEILAARQPSDAAEAFHFRLIGEMAEALGLE